MYLIRFLGSNIVVNGTIKILNVEDDFSLPQFCPFLLGANLFLSNCFVLVGT